MDAELRLDHELVALETEGAVFGLLELKAPELAAAADRARLGIALVIDRSGSMSGPKLEVAKSCARYLAGQITAADRLGVVAYDDEATLVAALGGPSDRVAGAIDQVFPGGRTNLSGGWLKGVELLDADDADVRRVVLLTDGLANVGITDRRQLASLSAGAAGRGITTTTIGFGEGFDEELLSAMADAGQGHDHFAANPDEAPAIFAQEFEGLATLVAQNLSVEIRPGPGAIDAGILNEYPIAATSGGLQAALGDMFAGQTRKLVFRVRVPALSELGQVQVADVVVRWADVAGDPVQMHTRRIPITVNAVPGAEAAAESANTAVTEEVVILEAARIRKEARQLADGGDFDKARKLLAGQIDQLRSISPTSRLAATAADDMEELARFAERMEMRIYSPTDSKMLWEQSRRRHRSEDFRKRPERPQ